MSIANLQKEIENTQKNQITLPSKEIVGDNNLRREKPMTEREKVEIEMKKWQKKVDSYLKQIEKQKPGEIKVSKEKLKFEVNLEENEYDCIIPVDKPGMNIIKGEKEIFNKADNFNFISQNLQGNIVGNMNYSGQGNNGI